MHKLGHYDVVVNGGFSQPSCIPFIAPYCSHKFAFRMFEKKPNNCNYVSYKCPSFWLFTTGQCGYCAKNSDSCIAIDLLPKRNDKKQRVNFKHSRHIETTMVPAQANGAEFLSEIQTDFSDEESKVSRDKQNSRIRKRNSIFHSNNNNKKAMRRTARQTELDIIDSTALRNVIDKNDPLFELELASPVIKELSSLEIDSIEPVKPTYSNSIHLLRSVKEQNLVKRLQTIRQAREKYDYFTVTSSDGPTCVHLYQVILHINKSVENKQFLQRYALYLETEDGASIQTNLDTKVLLPIFVYNLSGDFKLEPNETTVLRSALLRIEPDNKFNQLPVKFTKIALKFDSPKLCDILGVYINYMSDS